MKRFAYILLAVVILAAAVLFSGCNKMVADHVIDNPTSIGRMHSYLYVSSNEEEWEQDRQDLKDGCPIVYVENVDDELLSEFGSIGIEPRNGGVVRTA